MPKFLSNRQITQYQEDGYLAPVDVMSEDEAVSLRQRLEEIENKFPEEIHAENRNNSHLSFSCIDEIAHHPLILDAVEDLIGHSFALWGTVLFIKDPQSSGYVSWHQDATYMGVEPHDFVTPWLALTPSNRENGCMSMIPGSHKLPIQQHTDTFSKDNILTRGQAIDDVDEHKAVDLVLRPGQMSLHHARIIHGSQPNRSNTRRIGVVMQCYCPAGSRQVVGENYWLPIRGQWNAPGHELLQRPESDMHPAGVENRRKVNDNWADILYQGAEKKRDY